MRQTRPILMNPNSSFDGILAQGDEASRRGLSHSEAKKYLRHTHPMLGVDHILNHDFEQGWLHAARAISSSQPVFMGHFPNAGIYPGTTLAQDVIQLAIVLFVGGTGPLVADGRNEELTVISSVKFDLGHPVAPGYVLDLAVWKISDLNPRKMAFQFEGRVRDFKYYRTPNKLGITFKSAIEGECVINRVKRRIYDGIPF